MTEHSFQAAMSFEQVKKQNQALGNNGRAPLAKLGRLTIPVNTLFSLAPAAFIICVYKTMMTTT
jgi:hypothetical protein